MVSPYEINFLDSFTWRSLCKVELTEEDVRTYVQTLSQGVDVIDPFLPACPPALARLTALNIPPNTTQF